jgi:pimeloyl-ACP methyl ester carboxylesterase
VLSRNRYPPEALRAVKVPVLVLNGRADFANQSIGRLLEVLPHARSAACDGDHHSTPWDPSFQQAVVDFFEEQWRARGSQFSGPETQATKAMKLA